MKIIIQNCLVINFRVAESETISRWLLLLPNHTHTRRIQYPSIHFSLKFTYGTYAKCVDLVRNSYSNIVQALINVRTTKSSSFSCFVALLWHVDVCSVCSVYVIHLLEWKCRWCESKIHIQMSRDILGWFSIHPNSIRLAKSSTPNFSLPKSFYFQSSSKPPPSTPRKTVSSSHPCIGINHDSVTGVSRYVQYTYRHTLA